MEKSYIFEDDKGNMWGFSHPYMNEQGDICFASSTEDEKYMPYVWSEVLYIVTEEGVMIQGEDKKTNIKKKEESKTNKIFYFTVEEYKKDAFSILKFFMIRIKQKKERIIHIPNTPFYTCYTLLRYEQVSPPRLRAGFVYMINTYFHQSFKRYEEVQQFLYKKYQKTKKKKIVWDFDQVIEECA